MAKRSSSSKTAAIAGTLAGLLAAGLGAYYLHLQREEAAAPAMPASASMAPAAAAPAPVAGRSREQAIAALMALPELQTWSDRIEKSSGGKVHGALIEYDPKPRLVNGKQYYQLSFIENGSDAAQRWDSFLVSYSDGEILIEDDLNDELLSLERWRKEKNPMQRSGSGG